jgi:hypothetical protein
MAGIHTADSVRLDRRTGYLTGYKPLRTKAKAWKRIHSGDSFCGTLFQVFP